MDPNALRALAGALAKDDPTDVGRRLIAAAKRFAEGRRKVIGVTVQAALAGRLGDFPVKEVSAEIEALPARKKRAARKVAAVSKSVRATKQTESGARARKSVQVNPHVSRRKSVPTVLKGNKRSGRPNKQASCKALNSVASVAEIPAVGTKSRLATPSPGASCCRPRRFTPLFRGRDESALSCKLEASSSSATDSADACSRARIDVEAMSPSRSTGSWFSRAARPTFRA
jgi:hypothetical protein